MCSLKDKLKLHKVMELSAKKYKGKVLGKFAKKVVKKKAELVAKAEEVEISELVGLKARVSDEEYVQVFGTVAEIAKQNSSYVFLKVPGDFKTFKVPTSVIEIIDWLAPASVAKPLQLNAGDKAVLFHEFPDICKEPKEGLEQTQRLGGDHLLLQAWISRRYLLEVTGPAFISPLLVHHLLEAASVGGGEAAEILIMKGF